jgi:Fe(3+) dicitrate transport protein
MRTARSLIVTLAFATSPGTGVAADPPAEASHDETDPDIPRIEVVGMREDLDRIPGSGEVLDAEALSAAHVLTVNEALRKIPGLNPRDEEGFGLRPNVGVRGLNPTRSTKVTLLEDGIPLSYAPYGDNASYYHPPIDRYERIDVLKGAGQLLYGPQTIGAVIGYVTPVPTEEPGGLISATLGTRDYFNGHVRLGGKGLLLDYVRKQGNGARHSLDHEIDDLNLKALFDLTPAQRLIVRANHYVEDSMVTYSGLTNAELESFGDDYNPFDNDKFDAQRNGLSVTHEAELGESAELITSVYWSYFTRDWWRQSSTTTDGQCGAAFTAARAAGLRVDPDACNSRQGRLRDYTQYGVEPRLRLSHNFLGIESELETGVRAHYELQERKQRNQTFPKSGPGTLAEHNERDTDAYAFFAQNRFSFGPVTVTPALRLETIRNERTSKLANPNQEGSDRLSQWIPGLGINYNPTDHLTLFAGVHRGFAPPRTEDIIGVTGGVTGTHTEVKAEESTNFELGMRARPTDALIIDATYFRNDFERLIAVGSIAGGSTPLAEGEALFEGLELAGLYALASGPYVRLAYTYVWEAEQSDEFRQVVDGAVVAGSRSGNRQPYAPEHELSATLGFERGPFDAQVELVFLDDMYSDFNNTHRPEANANGQVGVIGSHTIFNLAVNYELEQLGTTLFFAVKNVGDREYIVDRTRGIQLGMPRLIQFGATYAF